MSQAPPTSLFHHNHHNAQQALPRPGEKLYFSSMSLPPPCSGYPSNRTFEKETLRELKQWYFFLKSLKANRNIRSHDMFLAICANLSSVILKLAQSFSNLSTILNSTATLILPSGTSAKFCHVVLILRYI